MTDATQGLTVVRETVRAAGHDVAVVRLGPAGGGAGAMPPVVLVHGIGVSGRYFEPLARELARTGPVLVPDLPGFGASRWTGATLGIAEHARVVTELVAREGWSGVVLVGHSMGTQVVTEAAAASPGLASAVALFGPVTEPGARSAVRQGLRLLRGTRHETPRANWTVFSDYFRAGPRRYLATLPHMIDYPLEDRLAELVVPVLLMRGGKDPVAQPQYLEGLARRALDARIAEAAGAGHVLMMRRPGEVADEVRGLAGAAAGLGAERAGGGAVPVAGPS
ncbi:alpha/beta fold hydrolase [Actinotalea sp. JY-7885]|uniref:alpha/beta fold hydrolase n=1 Tax=Actinotalea sp. JY-7885 TaxID=2758576 RepID=UPI00165D9B9A|nr:alpha/beta fold hydrolase [Actinotalea sp. JY-7885]